MSLLSHIEKQKVERELGMESGYVLNFSNRTIEEFFREVVQVQIYDSRYDRGTNSKAQRVRAFWDVATDKQLRAFFRGILEGWTIYSAEPISTATQTLFEQILRRLGDTTVPAPAPAAQQNAKPSQINEQLAQRLRSELMDITRLEPQPRGYAFEAFLKGLFDAYGLLARASFRNTGEQIDGSFVMDHETYLLEAKWENSPTGDQDLLAFEGKVRQKASWARGLFVSISGFSEDGLVAFGRGKPVVCMDGFDLSEILNRRLSFVDVLAAKVRRAAETGNPFIRVRDLNI